MAYPEKVERNERIYYLHVHGCSYRDIAKKADLKSVKNVYRIVARMRVRHKNVPVFIQQFEIKNNL